jgi:hypothetical protein
MRYRYLVLVLFIVTACTPRLAKVDRPVLTPSQLSTLTPGVSLTEVTTTYYPFRHQRVYARGPVQVDRLADGQLRYQRTGRWEQFYPSGIRSYEVDYRTGQGSQYNPDGTLNHDVYNEKMDYAGDSVQVNRWVRFNGSDRRDTLYVQHFYYRNNKSEKVIFSKDFKGQRVIKGPGW